MSSHASGAENACPFDPAAETHYAFSEITEFELRTLVDALIGVSQLAETPPDELGPTVEPVYLSALFRALANLGHRLLEERVLRVPAAKGRR
ncbi:MAG TPA: hypothetical protein VFF98_17310 [Novosphingobium sp.]|nr:hypothetical protein [Novosphingobium sp.]HZV08605.1 hypothetical protein [Novosphingobium sp.]